MYELNQLRARNWFIHIIHSFLCSLSFAARYKHTYLPMQGSLLSPTQFNLYINDVPAKNTSHLVWFVNDTSLLYFPNPYKLQYELFP